MKKVLEVKDMGLSMKSVMTKGCRLVDFYYIWLSIIVAFKIFCVEFRIFISQLLKQFIKA